MQLDPQAAMLDADGPGQSNARRADLLHRRNLLESHICRLPAELFSRIISLSIIPIQYDRQDRPITISNTKDLFRLGSVCSHWYHATQSDTQFWGTFALCDIDVTDESVPDYVSLLRHYYKHVGTAGLSVWIYHIHVPSRPGNMLHQIFPIILEDNGGKLRSFHVWDFYPPEHDYCIATSIFDYAQRDVQFTRLVELEFSWDWEIPAPPCALFRNSPLLRTLSLDIRKHNMMFPWNRITTMKICNTNPEHALLLLSSHPHFTDFSFEQFFDHYKDSRTWFPKPHVLFDMQLTTKFGWRNSCRDESSRYDPWCIQLLFAHFRFPNLRQLDWSAAAPSDNPSTRDFFASMQRLERLGFHPSARSCISQYFDIFENLKTLDIKLGQEADFDRQWVKKLIITPGNGNLFPQLQGLNITSSSDPPCSALIAILYSRICGPIPWTRLEVDLDSLTLPPYVGSSAQLQHRGRLVEFSFENTAPKKISEINWASSSHYGALQNLISQAKEVYGGLKFPGIKLVFEN